ncbi:MAG: hypothetical protein OQL19_12005 [Gammaproteobacteria bacterium]|nr:hypothetical protein [Gammaproteobacteria bacterium]
MLLSIVSMRWSVSTLNSLTETQAFNHLLLSDMLMLRRNEKDFLLRSDIKYLDKFNKNYDLMMDNINKLSDLLNDNRIDVENYDSLKVIMKTYQTKFHQLVDTSKTIGLNPKSGLRGTLRNSVHKTETLLKEVTDYKLAKDMLMLRRNEKDFLMRKDTRYIDKFNNNFLIFIDDIKNSKVDETLKSQILSNTNAYKKDFLQLTALTEKKGLNSKSGILGDMRKTIHQSEEQIDSIHLKIEDELVATSNSIQRINLIASLVIAFLVVGFTFLIAQSISRSLSGFVKTLQEI